MRSGLRACSGRSLTICVDVAQHICASEGWGPPKDNGDALRLLRAHGVLPAELAGRLRKAVGFRNVLVHEYVEVDDNGRPRLAERYAGGLGR